MSLFDQPLQSVNGAPVLAGAMFDEARDTPRLTKQLDCILEVVKDAKWRTIDRLVSELHRQYPGVNFPANSVQAQLRNLRKVGYRVEKQNVAKVGFLCEYRVLAPASGVRVG